MVRTLVMLLAGGRGTRLNILAAHRAKPAVPFAGMYRILDFTLSNCMNARLGRVGVLTQYRPQSLVNHLGSGEHWDMAGKTGVLKILPPYQASDDFDWYHGTADAVYQNLNFIWRYKPERVLILSGDHIYRMDYRQMLDQHREAGSAITIAAMPVPWEETHRFGIIVADEQRRVVGFQEKPKQARSNLASMGIYVFETEVLLDELKRMAASGGTDFGADVIPSALERRRIGVFPFTGYWRDVGTIDSYFDANRDVLKPDSGIQLAQWKVRTNLLYESVYAMPPAAVRPGGKLKESLVSAGCQVAGKVERSILSPGVVVEKGAEVSDCIVMHRAVIRAGARVVRAIVDKRCIVGEGAVVGSYETAIPNAEFPSHLSSGLVVMGKAADVPAGATVGANTIVFPGASGADFGDAVPPGSTIRPGKR